MKKITFIFALLCASVMSFAIDWSGYAWIGNGSGNAAYTDKFKMTLAEGQAVVNIQQPGFATAPGIYTTLPAGIISCSLPASAYDVQGAGMILHVAAFTAQETEVTVTHGTGTAVFTVYYADGTTGGGGDEPGTGGGDDPEPAGINWNDYSWIGNGSGNAAYTDKFKMTLATGQAVVNIQQPGFATKAGIYTTLPAGIISCSLPASAYDVQGAGMILHVDYFTYKETEITVTHGTGTAVFTVYYADGIEGSAEPEPEEIYDVNFALQSQGGVASAKSGNDAGLANNGNTGDRWWSETAEMTDAEKNDQWWQVDLGQRRIFNTIQIVWEGAWGKSFDIQISDDGNAWTTVKEIRNQNIPGPFPYEQTIDLDANKTARYVRFQGIERGTGYAYSFWEFRVLLPGVSVLTSIDLTAAGATTALGGAGMVMTATPKDQNGQAMEAAVSYEITPAAAGHMDGNTFIPDQIGNASIRAYNGEVYSNAVVVAVYEGTNVALNKGDDDITASGYDTGANLYPRFAVDDNDGSLWSARVGETGDERVYDAWIAVDLGAYYNINLIAIRWEGACSRHYHVDFSTDGTNWRTAYNAGWDAVATHWEYLIGTGEDATKVKYVRVWSTEAVSQYGTKIMALQVYGTEWVDTGDTEAPVMTSANLASCSFHKAVIDVAATDNHEVARFHVVDAANGIDANFAADVNGQAQINLDVNESTEYHLTVTAIDAANNESTDLLVEFTSPAMGNDLALNKPVEASGEDPAQPATNAVIENDALWWSALSEETGDLRIYDAWLSVDLGGFYDINKIRIRWEGACSKNYRVEFSANKTDWRVAYLGGHNAVATHWEEFMDTEEDNTKVRYVRVFSTEAVSQYGIKIMALRVYGIPWVPAGDAEKPVMVSASLESNTYNSAIINVAATDDYEVMKYHVVDAVNGINAEYTPTDGKITITGLAHSTEYHMTITAIDAASKESDNSIVVDVTTPVYQTAPATAAPVPAWPADQVKSLYSDTYEFAPASLNSYNECWWDCPNMAEGNVDGNHYLNYDLYRNGMIGVQFADVPVAIMEKIHIDIWSSAAGSVTFRPITAGGPDNIRKTLDLAAQQWNSFDLDMSEFDGHIWSDLYQYTFENYSGLVGEHICVDNVYFYRTTPYVDDVLPTNASASLVATGFYSVTITAQAEDNSGAVNFSVMNGENEVATGAAASGVATTITVANLTPGTAYNFNVIAKDEAGNALDPIAVAATTKVMPTAAPMPDVNGKKVVNVFSDAIEGGVGTIHSGGWGESTAAQWLNISENDKVFYAQNFNWAGWHSWGADVNVTEMQYLHVDIYSTGMTKISFTPISHDPTNEGNYVIDLTPNAWTSVDIPLSEYANVERNKIFQFKFMNPVYGNEFMADNVYFWAYSVTANEAQGTDAGGWATFASPIKLAVPTGLTAYKASYEKTETEEILNLTSIDVIPANQGVILKGTAGTEYIFAPTDAEASDVSDNVLVGCVTRTDVSAVRATKDIFCMRYSGSYDFTGFFLYEGQYVPAGKAYLALPKPSQPSSAPRKVRFVIKNEQTATGVENTNADYVETVKYLENGQLFIRRGEAVYTIEGVRVK